MNRQSTLFLLLIIALGVGAYFWFSSRTPALPQAAEEDATIGEIETRIANIRRLKTLELDTALFKDEAFRALEDFAAGTEVIIQPGRTNPFAPF